MKAFNKIFSVVAIAVILLFVVVNIILAADQNNWEQAISSGDKPSCP